MACFRHFNRLTANIIQLKCSALLRVTNDNLKSLDSHNDVVLVLLDVSAAFGTLDNDVLLSHLHSYFAFDGIVLRWFSSYLRARSQTVSVNGITSSPRNLMYGVPQGSILGPLLFTLFIVPLQDVISSYNLQSMFYADDTQLYIYIYIYIYSLNICNG